ncbi:MAG: NADH-quinone oxidoreductase subunit A [Alphaproteobacteria bacterium]|jgi:NADH-quinone oxidoreductase subunit A|nr:NADH-quinone oxidoreductase subunit A [Thalassospira sp.]MCE2965842.1 NADH-quinone oxidoreductase subunit A [Alphaproteobacteria bacterium]
MDITTAYLTDYLPILLFLLVAAVVCVAAVSLSLLAGINRPDAEKVSQYECGFEPFESARIKFDVRFYLVAILFIIFDLEVAFLFPWAITLKDLGDTSFWSMMLFLGILTVGFIYEWKKGALDWE